MSQSKHMYFKEMRKLHRQGYKCIVGVDEAGRGPLAGPVLASAVCLTLSLRGGALATTKQSRGRTTGSPRFPSTSSGPLAMTFQGIRDSKKLTEKQREKWYRILTKHSDIEWAVASVSQKMIDKINILEATKLAMWRAVEKLDDKLKRDKKRQLEMTEYPNFCYSVKLDRIDCLIIDGNFDLAPFCHSERSEAKRRISKPMRSFGLRPQDDKKEMIYQKSVPKADDTIFNCIAAGIIAKVTRDRIMKRIDKKYPEYGFCRHKGYGTKAHLAALRKYGACEIHRRSFKPVATFLTAKKLRKKLPPGR